MNNLNLTVDISQAAEYLPRSEKNRWSLRVFDDANGNQRARFTSAQTMARVESEKIRLEYCLRAQRIRRALLGGTISKTRKLDCASK